MTVYEKAGPEVTKVAAEAMRRFHDELSSVEARIGVYMATAEKDEHGEPLGMAVAVGGYPCAAKIKINSYRERVEGKPDATIYVDADRWEELNDDQRLALMDHELEHLEVKLDSDTNAPQSDDIGRPKFKVRKHDHQFGWFDSIARRHADASFEVRQAQAFIDKCGQSWFGWASPPAAGGETLTFGSGSAVDTIQGDGGQFADDDARYAEKQAATSPTAAIDADLATKGRRRRKAV